MHPSAIVHGIGVSLPFDYVIMSLCVGAYNPPLRSRSSRKCSPHFCILDAQSRKAPSLFVTRRPYYSSITDRWGSHAGSRRQAPGHRRPRHHKEPVFRRGAQISPGKLVLGMRPCIPGAAIGRHPAVPEAIMGPYKPYSGQRTSRTRSQGHLRVRHGLCQPAPF